MALAWRAGSPYRVPPPNNGMELTVQKRYALCKEEEQRARRFFPAAHPRC
jgi:hypothetical protein